MAATEPDPDPLAQPRVERASVYRHGVATRLWHWITAIAVIVLIGSGLMISNAHPHLYWGNYGANFDQPWLSLPHFPGWITIPSSYNLAMARRWHLLFALVLAFGLLAFMAWSLVNRHFQKDLGVRLAELRPSHLWTDFKAHLALRFHDAEHPKRYNIYQKLSYAAVIFLLLPLLILSGMMLSPAMNAGLPWLLELFGGRASARSIHFVAAALLTLFVIVHLALVILAGPVNEVRSMITGRWRLPEEDHS